METASTCYHGFLREDRVSRTKSMFAEFVVLLRLYSASLDILVVYSGAEVCEGDKLCNGEVLFAIWHQDSLISRIENSRV